MAEIVLVYKEEASGGVAYDLVLGDVLNDNGRAFRSMTFKGTVQDEFT